MRFARRKCSCSMGIYLSKSIQRCDAHTGDGPRYCLRKPHLTVVGRAGDAVTRCFLLWNSEAVSFIGWTFHA